MVMDAQDTFFSGRKMLDCRGKLLRLGQPVVMGILNITPDSFFDGGRYAEPAQALVRAKQLLIEGAALLDVGACSTRPGSEPPSGEEEWARLAPVLGLLQKEVPQAIVSVDTYRPAVAEKALAAGASLINDISGGTLEPGMAEVAAAAGAPYVLMHIQGSPFDMQREPKYTNVVQEVRTYFETRLALLHKAGVKQVVLDPGFGFGKTVAHNFELLRHLDTFVQMGYPVLAGLSRKSMLNKLLGISKDQSLNATTAVNTIALLNGASILRVHDVKEAVEVVRAVDYLRAV